MHYKRLILNHIPLWKGQKKLGVKYAPALIDSLIRNIVQDKIPIKTNLIDESIINKNDNFSYISKVIKKKLESSFREYKSGDLIINIGGDHGISINSIPPMISKFNNLQVLWFDAHADINSPESSISGNFHGMPVYLISELYSSNNPLKLSNLSYYGIRDLDKAESDLINKYNINSFTNKDIENMSSNEIINKTIEYHNLYHNKIHLSIDIDGIDPYYCPSTGTKSDNGIKLEKICEIIDGVKLTENIVSLDIVEFNPLIGSEKDVEKTYNSINTLFNILLN